MPSSRPGCRRAVLAVPTARHESRDISALQRSRTSTGHPVGCSPQLVRRGVARFAHSAQKIGGARGSSGNTVGCMDSLQGPAGRHRAVRVHCCARATCLGWQPSVFSVGIEPGRASRVRRGGRGGYDGSGSRGWSARSSPTAIPGRDRHRYRSMPLRAPAPAAAPAPRRRDSRRCECAPSAFPPSRTGRHRRRTAGALRFRGCASGGAEP